MKSKSLYETIEKLREQRDLLAQRLKSEKQVYFGNSSMNLVQFLLKKKNGEKPNWEHVHLENVGILQVNF